MQRDDTKTVTVYTSASGHRTAKYSVQDGRKYRELDVNRAKGYNNKVTFLSEMGSEELKEILIEKIIVHICCTLIPYVNLSVGCKINDVHRVSMQGKVKDEKEGIDKIFDSFVELVKQDYNRGENISTKLDSAWVEKVKKKYNQVCHESFSDTSSVSSEPLQENYSSMFVS